jgi:hypothetical protein
MKQLASDLRRRSSELARGGASRRCLWARLLLRFWRGAGGRFAGAHAGRLHLLPRV